MLLKKLFRTIGVYKVQFVSMIIMIALGAGVFIGFNIEWTSIDKNTAEFYEQTGFADYRIVRESGFTADETEEIAALDGVTEAGRFISVVATVDGKPEASLALTVTENEKVSFFKVTSGEEYDPESTDKIWLSEKFAEKNDIKLGDDVTLKYKTLSIGGKVAGLIKSSEYTVCVRDETQLMPDFAKFGFAYVSPAAYLAAAHVAYYPQINVISKAEKADFCEKVNAVLGSATLVLTKNETISYSGPQGEIEEGKTMGSILPVMFLLIAVLTMVTTMHRLTVKEKTQIGTLKALGFKNRRILLHYSAYALMIGVIGSVLGIALGFFIGWFIINPNGMMGTYIDIPVWKLYMPWFCWLMVALMIGFLTLIGYLSVRKMLKGTAADALRPYTPKKMKKSFLERTGMFNKASFGTKWNLRDVTRHKSRTFMTIFGILGCMILIVGSLGMRDTMNAFLDTYYSKGMNYETRVYLAENADSTVGERIADKFGGEWSASVAVELSDRAVSLDVYNVNEENGKVRFTGDRNDLVTIGNEGAYICRRIAESENLTVGDEFTVKPYGTDKTLTIKVAKVIRSVTENIVVSPEYAEKIGLTCGTDYNIDSVYANVPKTEVAATVGAEDAEFIKNSQEKKEIMDSFDTFTELMDMMIVVLIVAAMVLGVVVLYNLGVMSYTERYREMATLKVVGFKDKKIGSLLIGQNLWLTVVGVLLGIPLGIGVLDYLIKALASEYEMNLALSPLTLIISAGLTFAVSTLVSLAVSKKNKKIDMVEALKGAE